MGAPAEALPQGLSLFDLSGRRALVTGASQGIGLALARGLAAAGAAVVLNARDAQPQGGSVELSTTPVQGGGLAQARARWGRVDRRLNHES